MGKISESEHRDGIAQGAKKEREQLVKMGGRDPGQEKMEKVWKDSVTKSETQRERGGQK